MESGNQLKIRSAQPSTDDFVACRETARRVEQVLAASQSSVGDLRTHIQRTGYLPPSFSGLLDAWRAKWKRCRPVTCTSLYAK